MPRGASTPYSGGTGYSQNSGVVAVHNPSVTLPVSNPPQVKAWHGSPLSQSPASLHTWMGWRLSHSGAHPVPIRAFTRNAPKQQTCPGQSTESSHPSCTRP